MVYFIGSKTNNNSKNMVQVFDKQCNFIFICVLMLKSVQSQQEIGSRCTQDNGRPGICRLISNCPSAISALQNQGTFPKTCGFDKTQPIVCCEGGNASPPSGTAPTNRPTTRPQSPTPRPTQQGSLRVGDKAKAKCKDYAQYVYIYPTIQAAPVADCVVKGIPNVVGGELAEVKEFPHMAVIGYEDENNEIKWQCGGSLISEQFILTAAHCLYSQQYGEPKHIRVGDLNIASDRDEAQPQDFTISEKFRHPNYSPPSQYNDIGLLKLNRKARLNNYVRPACLEMNRGIDMTIKPLATGWGRVEFLSNTSDVLLKVALEYFSNSECDEKYKNNRGLRLKNGIMDDTQVCAGSHTERKDTCQGDSGGPLQVANVAPYCTYNLVGVTSFGKGCGVINIPGVYTRVSNYIEWIEGIVWP